ncbi:hypothetical protein B0J11DRAFT_486455, partial [Dendryphion nanum]
MVGWVRMIRETIEALVESGLWRLPLVETLKVRTSVIILYLYLQLYLYSLLVCRLRVCGGRQ